MTLGAQRLARPIADHNGKELKVGQLVAFNLSGEVFLGHILQINTRVDHEGVDWRERESIHIKIKIHKPVMHLGKISVVTSEKHLIVFEEDGNYVGSLGSDRRRASV